VCQEARLTIDERIACHAALEAVACATLVRF
jgi:hypothetical protein